MEELSPEASVIKFCKAHPERSVKYVIALAYIRHELDVDFDEMMHQDVVEIYLNCKDRKDYLNGYVDRDEITMLGWHWAMTEQEINSLPHYLMTDIMNLAVDLGYQLSTNDRIKRPGRGAVVVPPNTPPKDWTEDLPMVERVDLF
jgi:CO dehydrogenase/acetyl-CoA synthase epsilon subunit